MSFHGWVDLAGAFKHFLIHFDETYNISYIYLYTHTVVQICYDMICYYMIWCDLIWYDMILYELI